MNTNPPAPADSPCELLPCPFCGGDAQRKTETRYEHVSAREAQSDGLGVSAGTISHTYEWVECMRCFARVSSANQWNTRTPPVLSARPNEAQLMQFYSVDNLHDLIEMQAHHIERLQSRLPNNDQPIRTHVREG